MKQFLSAMAIIGLFFLSNVHAANEISVEIRFQQAKDIYNIMTGSAVQTEGSAGHLYATGKSIICKYTDADMADSQDRPIPQEDPSRYICIMLFDHNGLASPSPVI